MQEKLDKFCDILPKSISPRKRSAAARVDKLSLLTEISDEAMKHYTPEHLKVLLDQRANVSNYDPITPSTRHPPCFPSLLPIRSYLCEKHTTDNNPQLIDQLSQPDYPDHPESFYQNRPLPISSPHPNPPPGLPIPPTSPSNDNGLKPWFPLQGGECQFKCCHYCRPSLKERSFLSLNGIANGDIPSTSIMGFGFHLMKQRPVALVEHVKNLGLRPNPTPVSYAPSLSHHQIIGSASCWC